MPTREIFWNIGSYGFILYWLLIPIFLVLVYGVSRRIKLWLVGRPADIFPDLQNVRMIADLIPDPRDIARRVSEKLPGLWGRLWSFVKTSIVDGFLQLRFLRDLYPGIIHFLIFWGCIVFLLGALIDFITHYAVRGAVDSEILHGLWGGQYLSLSLAVDIFGIIVLIGLAIATYRRYIQRPDRLDNKPENAIALIFIAVIVLTGFLIEGLRIAYFTQNPAEYALLYPALGLYNSSWAAFSPGGWVVAWIFHSVSSPLLLNLHAGFWWFHIVVVIGAISYYAITFASLSHIVVAPFNVLFRSMRPKGALSKIDIEEAETFGVSSIDGFTWKQIMDLDSCTGCGRCQDNCPAYLSGKPLSPKKLIQDLKAHWLEVARTQALETTDGGNPEVSLIGDVITEDMIWACTTCRSCQEQCPVFVEHIDKIIDMRRSLVLEQAVMPETAETALKSLEARGHPWRGTMASRTDWAEGLDVKLMSDDSDVEYLYWVGCTAALVDQNMKTAAAMARILKAAGIKFAILGPEESCCGDPARRIGNEYLYQMQVERNIEILKGYNVKRIVTACPHCYNTLKWEYPQFGAEFEVIHHTQLIADLLKQGRIRLSRGMKETIAYHDSCYLGRYNDIYDEPRRIIKAIPGAKVVELERSRRKAFCCGAGGGRLWMEENIGTRINEMRTQHVINAGASIVATACPYCMQMFEDGIKTKRVEEQIKAIDIAELVSSLLE